MTDTRTGDRHSADRHTVVLRLDKELHSKIVELAAADERSVAQVIARSLRAFAYDPGAVLDILTREQFDGR